MTIISLEKQKRLNKLEELKKKTNYLMNLKRIKNSETNFENSSSASNDAYMNKALNKVRQSDVTFNNDYTNMTGSGIFHPKTKPSPKLQKKKNELETIVRKLEKEINTEGRNTKSRIKYEKISPRKITKKIDEEITWKKICEQVGKKKKKPEYFFAKLRESHTISNKKKLLQLKRSRLYE